jgi:unspecific monooxygenase
LTEHSAWLAAEVDRLAESWLGHCTVHGAVAGLEALMARSFARFCFGTRPAAGVVEGIRDLLQALFPIVSSPLRAPAPLRRVLPRYVRARHADARLRVTLADAVRAPGSGGIAEVLLGERMPLPTVVRMLVATGIAAYGVPASTVAWALTELARNADVADSAAAEPVMLRWVLDETLRLWPATWLVYRSTERDVTCAGWEIPGQSAVMVCPYLIHRTAPCFDRPDEFIPSRWAALTPPAGAYLPFGGGPRRCVGSRLAVAELEATLRVLADRLRLSLPTGPPTPDVRRTLTAAGLVLEVKPR